MKTSNPFKILSLLLSAAYFLSACDGTLPPSTTSQKAPEVQANVVVFRGIVEAINGNQWTVSGQQVTVDPQIALNSNIKVGDRVKVDANVSSEGAVVARKVESPAHDDIVPTPSADAGNTPDAGASPAVSSTPDPSSAQIAGNDENEVFGTVEALGVDTITVNGLTYILANLTEIKDAIAVGDPVRLHVMLNADGKLTVREIEKSADPGDDNDNSNDSNDNSDDNSNADNSNDDWDGDSNGNGSSSDSGDG